jgi:hypothetical protein
MSDPNEKLEQIVNDAMARQLRAKDEPATQPLFENIEDYQKSSGKRFRMTKDQVSRGISRETAFQEFIQKLSR